MALIFIWLAVVGVLIETLAICGQAITPSTMCEDRTTTAPTGSMGVIKHLQKGAERTCTLVVSGLMSGSYIGIEGAFYGYRTRPDCLGKTKLTINGARFCAGSLNDDMTAVRIPSSAGLNITVTSTEPSCTLEYYSNVVTCGSDITLPSNAKVNQLSGVIFSYIGLRSTPLAGPCLTTVKNLPSTQSVVRFDLVDNQRRSDGTILISGTSISSTLVVKATNRFIDVRYTPHNQTAARRHFAVKYTVLSCGDVPTVPGASRRLPPTPWLIGSKVNYACNEANHIMKNNSSIECALVVVKARWNNQPPVQCLPKRQCKSAPHRINRATSRLGGDVLTATYRCRTGYESDVAEVTSVCASSDPDNVPWTWSSVQLNCTLVPRCVSPPTRKDHATYRLSKDNLTATYWCDRGYRSAVAEVKSVCSSRDPGNQPWTWSYVQLDCQLVECQKAAEIFPAVNDSIIYQELRDKYYYNDIFIYECDVGYNKPVDVMQCQSDGSWSATPRCDGCDEPIVENGEITHKTVTLAVYSCNDGFGREGGDHVMKCELVNGRYVFNGSLICQPHTNTRLWIGISAALGAGLICAIICVTVTLLRRKMSAAKRVETNDRELANLKPHDASQRITAIYHPYDDIDDPPNLRLSPARTEQEPEYVYMKNYPRDQCAEGDDEEQGELLSITSVKYQGPDELYYNQSD